MKKPLLLFVLLLIFTACNSDKKQSTNNELHQELTWFNSIENFESDPQFQDKFYEKYAFLLDAEKYEDAKLLLYYYGTVLHDTYFLDTIYLNKTKSFIEKNPSLIQDTTLAMLNHYVAHLYLCNFKALDAISWSQRALSLTDVDLGESNAKLIKSALAYSYTVTNQPKLAVEIYLDIVKLAEKTGDYAYVGRAYNGMALIYTRLRLGKRAQQMYQKAVENFGKSSYREQYFLTYGEYIQNNFGLNQDTTETLSLIDQVLLEYEKWDAPTGFATCYINGMKFLKSYLNDDLDSALYYNNLSMEFMKNNEANLYAFKINDFQIYFRQHGKFKEEKEVVRYANLLIEEEDFSTGAILYNQLHEGAIAKGKLDDALLYKNKEVDLRELLQQQNADGQLFELEIKYETEKKEAELVKQRQVILQNNLIITILALSLAFIITVFFIVSQIKKRRRAQADMQRQQDFTSQLFLNTEEERSRIANELHDGVNHQLLTIKNNIATDKKIQAEDIGEVIEEVRNISRNLHPSILQTAGFEVAINNLCDRVTEAGLFATCEIDYLHKLSKNKELQLYRIIQEALNNTLKHGKANAAKVILTSQDNFLHLEIKDNGSGFDVDEQINNSKSFGLQSILQRAKAIMAKVKINSSSSGTVILLKIPV
jgi:signal transduction histidine kinase